MQYFDKNDTLFDITEKYPETISVFTSNGFSQMGNKKKRLEFAKKINLQTAMLLKQQDINQFSALLVDAIERHQNSADITLQSAQNKTYLETIKITGLLPCPVRIPLMEKMNQFVEKYEFEYKTNIEHDLKAASMGLGWLEEDLKNLKGADALPDIFLSAGFDLFFNKKKIGKLKEEGVFEDLTSYEQLNDTFGNIDLKDPNGHYAIISVVPAVFLINTKELGNLPTPKSWKDILNPIYERRVSLPISDFDLFNSILIHLHKEYGKEGIEKLGKSLLKSLHPTQMIKSEIKKDEKPIITIMPYFFTKMVKESSAMQYVWPEDGAIISPILMLSKSKRRKKLKPIVDFLAGKEVGEILSHQGLFPSTNPAVKNNISAAQKWMWVGWDYIDQTDIHLRLKELESIFNKAAGIQK
jgi:ABC-type Fe3+ transport system substrate-binding protein